MVCLGVIGAPHGVGGQVRIRTFTEAAEDIAAYGPLTDDVGRVWRLQVQGPCKGGVIASLQGIGDRDAAQRLKGQKLHVARGALPRLERDVYYHNDLIGLDARRDDGTPFGRVVAVHDFGAGDLLEIRRGDGGTLLLPFTAETVPEVDLEAGRIVVVPPRDLEDEHDGGRR